MRSVLFVCLGNICRSPMAEAIFEGYIQKQGLEKQLRCDSAGIERYHLGEPAQPGTVEVLRKRGLKTSSHARQVQLEDFSEFDDILAMDSITYAYLAKLYGSPYDGLFMMRDFDPDGKGQDVPDPYYGGTDGFEDVFSILTRSLTAFLAHLKQAHLKEV